VEKVFAQFNTLLDLLQIYSRKRLIVQRLEINCDIVDDIQELPENV
jgi:hypothetical protein